jgi:hypothetical protein
MTQSVDFWNLYVPFTTDTKEIAMTTQMLDNYRRAYRDLSVKDFRRGFKVHCIIYIIMNIFLVAFNLFTNPDVLWCLGALFGWGAGVVAHYVKDVVKIGGKLDAMEARALETASRM